MFFFVILFVHSTHTIDLKTYNIHNFSLKQSRGYLFFLVIQPLQLHGGQIHHLWLKTERLFLNCFYKTNATKNTQKRTPRWPTQRRDSKYLLQRSFMPALPRQGDDVTNTKQLCSYCCSAENCITIVCSCCNFAEKVRIPPLSLNSFRLPVASSFLSSIPQWKELKKNNTSRSLSLLYSNGKNVNILQGCLAWRYWEASLRAEPCSRRGAAAVY